MTEGCGVCVEGWRWGVVIVGVASTEWNGTICTGSLFLKPALN